jgi:hypothetical protein
LIGYIWIYWHISSELLRVSILKEGAVGAVREQPPQRSRKRRRRHELKTSERKNRQCTVRLFGTNSLKEGAI